MTPPMTHAGRAARVWAWGNRPWGLERGVGRAVCISTVIGLLARRAREVCVQLHLRSFCERGTLTSES